MDLLEIGRTLGRVETENKAMHADLRAFMAVQGEKNKNYDDTHEYVAGMRAKGRWFTRALVWVAGLFLGGRK